MSCLQVHADGGHADENTEAPMLDEDVDVDAARRMARSRNDSTDTLEKHTQRLRAGGGGSGGSNIWGNSVEVHPDVTHLSWISLHQDWGHLLISSEDASVAVAPEPGRMKLKEANDCIKTFVGKDDQPQRMTEQSLTGIRNVLESVRVCVCAVPLCLSLF